MKKRELLDIRERLKEKVQEIAKMNRTEMVAAIKEECGWVVGDSSDNEVRSKLLMWAVHNAIPDVLCR